jgi:hypothetical protein
MGRFNSKPSLTYRNAFDALTALVEAEGTDAALRAYAEVTWEAYQKQYAEKFGLKLSSGRTCLARLLGKRCNPDSDRCGIPCHPPGVDHASLWLKDGKPYSYVYQPYGLSMQALRELVAMCERYGLECSIDTWPSWHFPGAVLTVEIKRKEG